MTPPTPLTDEVEAWKGQATGPGLCGWRVVGVETWPQLRPSVQAPSGSTWHTGLAQGTLGSLTRPAGPCDPPSAARGATWFSQFELCTLPCPAFLPTILLSTPHPRSQAEGRGLCSERTCDL